MTELEFQRVTRRRYGPQLDELNQVLKQDARFFRVASCPACLPVRFAYSTLKTNDIPVSPGRRPQDPSVLLVRLASLLSPNRENVDRPREGIERKTSLYSVEPLVIRAEQGLQPETKDAGGL